MINIKTGLPLALFALFIVFSPFRIAESRETVDRVVAIVNDDIITLSEVRETALSMKLTSTEQIDERTILQQIIEQKLFEQEADKLGIKVSEAELDAHMEQVKKKYNLTDEQMVEVLKKQNLTPESFREQWRLQTLGNKLLESRLKNRIVVTDEEIQEYYEQNYGGNGTVSPSISEGSDEEVKIAHILISAKTPNAAQKAGEVAELAKSGKDFGELAKEYSDDTLSANKGGDLGYFKKGDLIETLEVAVENTPKGKVSDPVQSPAGYHIIKVLEKTKPKSTKDPEGKPELAIDEETRVEITNVIYRKKAEVQLKDWIEKIRKNAYIDIKL